MEHTTTAAAGNVDRDPKDAARAMWALGDYPQVAGDVIPSFGPELVSACGIGPGQRVPDDAAGSGSVAITAAEAGARVVAGTWGTSSRR